MGSGPFDNVRKLLAGSLLLAIAGLAGTVLFTAAPAHAAAGINQQMNFQGRLLNAQGATVPDGNYNIQFKIYQDGDGQSVGNTTGSPAGTLKWTENWLNANSQGVAVRNGFLSVQLGTITSFGASIDWNQDTLWLSMNIAGTSTSCTPFSSCSPDGEMVPMKRMSATAYALNSLNANMLGGLSSAGFIQNTTSQQTADFNISGNGVLGGTVTAGGTVRSNTGFNVNGTAGSSASCSGGQILQDAVVAGGIITGGTCTAFSSGVTTVGTLDSQTKSSNGAVISGTSIYMQTADASNPGLVSTAAQTFAGLKTFGSGLNLSSGQTLKIDNVDILSAGALTFSAASASTITSASSQNLVANGLNGVTIQTNGITRAIFDTANGLYLGNGMTAAAPSDFTIRGTGSSTSGTAGSSLTLQGGNATVGNTNGGNLNLSGGNGAGTGANGLVVISTPTFSAAIDDVNCFTSGSLVTSSCTITPTSVNNASTIMVGFSQTGQIATLPDPTITTTGRLVYITAASGSSDFTLRVNGGGTGNDIAMRQNTTATMIWNGSDWTAAGASSSTTLQSAYDNTLQSAGGAELVVSKTSTTNGLTIRDSSVNSVNGTLLSVQTSSAANLISVNSNVTDYATNGGAETSGSSAATFPANTWSAIGSTISRYTTAGDFIPTGQASVSVVTPATANTGVSNRLSTSLTANMIYNVSFATRLSSGAFTDMNVYYSVDGTTASVACTTSQAVTTSVQTKVNCAFTAPSSGITSSNAILIRQTGATARTFYVDNLSVTIAADYNYATDGSVNDSGGFSTNWNSVSSATVTRSTAVGNDASNSAQVVTTGSGQGVRSKLSINPLTSTVYRLSVYASSNASGFNNFTIRYSRDGGTNFIDCADYNTQIISSTITDFTKVTCYITTDSTVASNPHVYFTQTDSTGRTFYVDTFSMTLSTNITPNVQIGGGINGGPVTLFTLDRAAAAPIASNNDALLGSMYYDTTLGKLQCYEADGWGACGSSPDNVVTISPEFTNAVMHGTGVGTMTSDICSDPLNINDGSSSQSTICGTNETYNFYKWTSPQPTAQTYSIYVTYQLPSTFKAFASGQTSVMGRTDSSNATVQYQIYRNNPATGLTACGSAVSVATGVQTSWQVKTATGAADPSTCSFAANDSIVFKIDMISSSTANAYVSNLNFTYSNR